MPYIHGDRAVRPCVIVVPGGGYSCVSPGEGELADDRWAEQQYGDDHCINQLSHLKAAVRSGALALPEPTRTALLNLFSEPGTEPRTTNNEVRVWPELALGWLDKTLGS